MRSGLFFIGGEEGAVPVLVERRAGVGGDEVFEVLETGVEFFGRDEMVGGDVFALDFLDERLVDIHPVGGGFFGGNIHESGLFQYRSQDRYIVEALFVDVNVVGEKFL